MSPVPFPMFVKLAGRRCVVVGAGAVAENKIAALQASGAKVAVIAPHASHRVRAWQVEKRITWQEREYAGGDLEGAFVVIAATSRPDLNRAVYRDARARGVLCNAVDDPEYCDFYFPALLRRGDLQIAISTNGRSPALAQRLRRELERWFGPGYEAWVAHLGRHRQHLFDNATIDPQRRRGILRRLASESGFKRFFRRWQAEAQQ